MNPDPSPSTARDRAVHSTHRLRSAVVGGSVAASLGIAGVLAAGAAQADAPAVTLTGTTDDSSGSSLTDGPATSPGSGLSTGTGPSHATTRGS